MTLNVAMTALEAAKRFPEKVAIQGDDFSFSYRELAGSVSWMKAEFQDRGLEIGDRVAVVLPNSFAFVATFYAILAAGGTVVPINPLLKQREVARILEHSDAMTVICNEDQTEAIAAAKQAATEIIDVGPHLNIPLDEAQSHPIVTFDLEDTSPCDDALILYTSGTTGDPKGVRLSHSSIAWITEVLAERTLAVTHRDVLLGALPLSHIFGLLAVMNVAVSSGASVVLQERFHASDALTLVDRHKVTVIEGVPAMLSALLEAQSQRESPPSDSLRLAFVGGQSTPVEVLRRIKSTYRCALVESYGTTETGSAITTTPLEVEGEEYVGTVGRPLWGVDVRIIDESGKPTEDGQIGEVFVRSLGMMTGYHKNPETTASAVKEGWFSTGDLGFLRDGTLSIVDRKKEMIIRGGYNVYPREIEEVIYEHPAVNEAAVIGVPDDAHGEEVVAVVALRQDSSRSDISDEIREFVRERVAAYKYPRVVYIVQELPKNATGKISKRDIDIDSLEPSD